MSHCVFTRGGVLRGSIEVGEDPGVVRSGVDDSELARPDCFLGSDQIFLGGEEEVSPTGQHL